MALPSFVEAAAFGVLNDIIGEFRSNEGYARPNRYEVLIYPPLAKGTSLAAGLGGLVENNSNMRKIALHCESVTLPGRNLNSFPDENTYGPVREIVDGVSFADDVSMTFHASGDMKERKFFENWQENAYNDTNWNVGYYWDYIGAVDIYMLDINEQRKFGLRLQECFPKTISQIELNGGEMNTVAKVTVSMNFRYWESLDATSKPPSLGEKITQTLSDVVEKTIHQNVPKVLNKLF